VFAVPDETVSRSKVADWLELKAIVSPDSRIGFGTLVSATALTENEPKEDIGDEDLHEEDFVLSAQNEIERRQRTVGPGYPFKISENGKALEFITPLNQVGSIYLFCLYVSQAFDYTIIPKKIAPAVDNRIRDLFQVCATVAAGGYVRGPAISFGFPRPDGMDFLKKLKRVYKLFGDGRPCQQPRKSAPPNVKDNGIDIIAWCRAVDELPMTHYLIGQVASGRDWVNKSVKPDREHFHKYWFVETPASQPDDAMFVPFGLEPQNEKLDADHDALLRDHMQNLGYRYGTFFYRDRIARHAAEGLRLIAGGESNIERSEELPEVGEWVNKYTERLRAL
jgi:hypothetical protein